MIVFKKIWCELNKLQPFLSCDFFHHSVLYSLPAFVLIKKEKTKDYLSWSVHLMVTLLDWLSKLLVVCERSAVFVNQVPPSSARLFNLAKIRELPYGRLSNCDLQTMLKVICQTVGKNPLHTRSPTLNITNFHLTSLHSIIIL